MIPRPQHFGDRAPFPYDWSGIVRIFEKPLFEALLLSAGGRAHYPGKQPYASIEDHHRADLTAGEDIITDRDLFDGPCVEDALVESLEAATHKYHALSTRELTDPGLRQQRSTRGQRQHRPAIRDTVDGSRQHVRLQHHAGPAARRRIINTAMLVCGEIADVAGVESPQAIRQRPPGEAEA